ncbi:MAG: hypothetical protein HYV23_05000 [Deltaproteobacteria bacterium]|nr:hypothetical protein [Deltaproteobacteria bacterium]
MSARLKDELRHVGVGFMLGLMGLVFGIFWAVYLTVNHESIHCRLLRAETISIEEKFVLNSGAGEAGGAGHEGHAAAADHSAHSGHAPASEPVAAHDQTGHSGHTDHSGHAGHEPEAVVPAVDARLDEINLMRGELDKIKQDMAKSASAAGHHGSPEMATAHGRLAKGHVHAMGLGILTIAVSMLLAFVPASPRAKTFAAACVGTGGLFYPLSWILMGMRTTALGSTGAEASVLPMVGLSVILVGLGLLLALVYTVRWLLKG